MGRLRGLVILFLFSIAMTVMAKENAAKPNTGNQKLDSILTKINNEFMIPDDQILDVLSAQVYIKGTSRPTKLGKGYHLLTNLVPFEAHKDRVTVVEAVCRLNYHNPCQLQFTPLSIRTNNRRGRKFLNESFQVLLPIYSMKRMKDNGSNKSHVMPFSDDGFDKYVFQTKLDTIDYEGKLHIKIYFSPKNKHHTLGTGYMIVGQDYRLKAIKFAGRVDFGMVDYFLSFRYDNVIKKIIPQKNHIVLGYNYGGTTGINEFDCLYSFDEFSIKQKESKRNDNLDLTDTYDVTYSDNISEYAQFPINLTHEEDSLLNEDNTISFTTERSLIERLPEHLVGSSNINAFGNDLKIYGPLAPASLSYDKRDRVTIRQRLRFSRMLNEGKSFMLKPDFGYSFGMKELRYKVTGEWIYKPRKRSGISISASNRTSEFSSKFQNKVNEMLKDTSTMKFEDLGVEHYRRHEIKVEHSTELANGLMLYTGASYNYRDPQKHGSLAMTQDQINSLIKNYYADFNPYLRLTWTPRQYYHYHNNQKLYIASYYPTFSLEVAQGVKNLFGSTSDYSRIEFDMQQTIKLTTLQNLSYHFGTGTFFRQKGEYFISYSFFARSMFPSTWDDHIGGTFNLLSDYWYNSSPSYCQAHIMYETPFLFLHQISSISKYIIKERIYLSNLWAEGKNSYTELGYGIGNNYFNVGLFTNLIGLEFYEVGIKATIEIDSHW